MDLPTSSAASCADIFAFIPNFYMSYDQNAAPLTAKLKFQLAVKVSFDPITFLGVGIAAAAEQAGNHPNYPQGWKGFGERYGAAYTNGFTDIMIGGAILPSLLHQDPSYFYQGTRTTKSRVLHAVSFPFVCRGDNGRLQPNYSTIGRDLGSAAIANAYYPASNRGLGLFLGNFLIGNRPTSRCQPGTRIQPESGHAQGQRSQVSIRQRRELQIMSTLIQ